ncbi:hypothetical protein L211DRAFT_854423 [Terfezia boudieri ATCC MYA-4762]|uniref:Uncharacterized protein n=1 Tax=Terfezia boudieri ATCC MYA-4762 TaxID=1051890 RepID=A0A3N4L5H4_9PEZI|nr:hypothetical protein L211DRAFT_854423 [Terfezia boudieri ATCC MYA-4762]
MPPKGYRKKRHIRTLMGPDGLPLRGSQPGFMELVRAGKTTYLNHFDQNASDSGISPACPDLIEDVGKQNLFCPTEQEMQLQQHSPDQKRDSTLIRRRRRGRRTIVDDMAQLEVKEPTMPTVPAMSTIPATIDTVANDRQPEVPAEI